MTFEVIQGGRRASESESKTYLLPSYADEVYDLAVTCVKVGNFFEAVKQLQRYSQLIPADCPWRSQIRDNISQIKEKLRA